MLLIPVSQPIRDNPSRTRLSRICENLQGPGIDITLLTFEPKRPIWSSAECQQWREELLEKQGIRWTSLRYHKSPSLLATIYDILVGNFVSCWLVLKYRVDIIHARGHVPTAMALLAQCAWPSQTDIRYQGIHAGGVR